MESSAIADYLELTYPDPPLRKDGSAEKEAQEATKDIFPAMAKLVKCHRTEDEPEKALLDAAAKFQTFWEEKKKTEEGECHRCPPVAHFSAQAVS